MKHFLSLMTMTMLLTSENEQSVSSAVPRCSDNLTPIKFVAPQLPARLHNDFTGLAVVSYVVDSTGQTRSPTMISWQMSPIGRSAETPIGYEEAIRAAIEKWEFSPQEAPCRNQTQLEIDFE